MENSLAGPHKVTHSITIRLSNSNLGIFPKELNTSTETSTWACMFIAANTQKVEEEA